MRKHKEDYDLEKMVHEYRDLGETSYELAEKYGVDSRTIRKWMRDAGVVIGKRKAAARIKTHSGSLVLKERCRKRIEKKLADEGGVLELVGYGQRFTLRCTVCGHVFEKSKGSYQHRFTCPECAAREIERAAALREQRKEERAQQREAAREWLLSVPRVCQECGDPFFSECESASYCSKGCRDRARNRRQAASRKALGKQHGTYRRRMRIEVTPETCDRSVTLGSVYKKFGGTCCQCGRKTYRTRRYSPLQATLDHIVALANNGTHTWDNVQLLCAECNSDKRDTGQMRMAI